MSYRFLILRIVIVCLSLLVWTSTVSLYAWPLEECEQEIEGTWEVEVWGGDSNGEQCWDVCDLTVFSDGTLSGGGSYFECSGPILTITGGQLFISSGCIIEGFIDTEDGRIALIHGGIIDDKMVFNRWD